MKENLFAISREVNASYTILIHKYFLKIIEGDTEESEEPTSKAPPKPAPAKLEEKVETRFIRIKMPEFYVGACSRCAIFGCPNVTNVTTVAPTLLFTTYPMTTPCAGFRCTSGKCISEAQRCDGHNDCGDNVDEEGCPVVTCGPHEFACNNHTCIPDRFVTPYCMFRAFHP